MRNGRVIVAGLELANACADVIERTADLLAEDEEQDADSYDEDTELKGENLPGKQFGGSDHRLCRPESGNLTERLAVLVRGKCVSDHISGLVRIFGGKRLSTSEIGSLRESRLLAYAVVVRAAPGIHPFTGSIVSGKAFKS